MSFSLLYKVPEEKVRSFSIRDLSLDRVVATICVDINLQKAALEVLSHPLTKLENIYYRQQILNDFLNHPDLLENMFRAYSDYDSLKDEWERARQSIYVIKSHAGRSTEVLMDVLILNAEYLKRVIFFPGQLYKILSSAPIESDGLIKIRDHCAMLMKKENFRELLSIIESISKLEPMNYSIKIAAKFDHMMRVYSSHLCEVYDASVMPPKTSFLSRLYKRDKGGSIAVESNGATNIEIDNLLRMAIMETSDAIDKMVKLLYVDMYGLSRELLFYKFAATYNQLMKTLDIPQCFPEVLDDKEDILKCKDLYDLFLVVRNQHFTYKIVANDVLLSQDTFGILIRGSNNSGKTVCLRSIGIAQVLAQAGITICAREAQISIRHGIYTQFASMEEFERDSYGRFENEVKEIAEIIYNLKPYSLILLNETFQTTAYDEGAEGMFDILSSISGLSVKWIFVTHILKLFDLFHENSEELPRVKFLKTCTDNVNRYKLANYDPSE